ncbi:MAG: hypothetical protein NVS4B1_36580 [Ktedonobacteraceae bacterium]
MTTYDTKAFDDLFGDEEGNFLVAGAEYKYMKPLWASGVDMKYLVPKELKLHPVKGFHYLVSALPDDFLAAAKILATRKTTDGSRMQAEFVTIQHGGKDKAEKEYVRLNENRYFILAHGAPTFNAIFSKVENQLGIAAGVFTKYDEEKQLTDTVPFVSVLAIHEGLYRAGYADPDTGAPKPVMLHMKGLSGKNEFLGALTLHANLIKKAKDLGVPERFAQYWAYAQSLDAAEDTVVHGKGNDVKDVYPIVSGHPAQKEWTLEYVESLFCGDEMFRMLFPMVMDMKTRRPGGEAIEWCREKVAEATANLKEFTGPKGQTIVWGKNKEAPEWLKTRKARLDSSVYSADAVHGTGNVPQQEDEEETVLDVAYTEVESLHRLFTMREYAEGIALAEKALSVLKNDIGNPTAEIEKTVLALIEKMKTAKKSLPKSKSFV